ncbi:hypothetical protein TELCIR_08614 [Teladorsagia circumcincta]|uniref:Uncharacterized protein n=1 Tax=Teladorsagia circumcincta TaxID=45464 RepID=A0A2G9UH37_TELCI|nr:hypothetical protein TELCIR_08614 [Teladorsagia circumcincta]
MMTTTSKSGAVHFKPPSETVQNHKPILCTKRTALKRHDSKVQLGLQKEKSNISGIAQCFEDAPRAGVKSYCRLGTHTRLHVSMKFPTGGQFYWLFGMPASRSTKCSRLSARDADDSVNDQIGVIKFLAVDYDTAIMKRTTHSTVSHGTSITV